MKRHIPHSTFVEHIQEEMRLWDVPGVAVAIVSDQELVFAEGFGQRDIANGLPVTTDTIFNIASCTKPFTTLAMGILVDEGLLEWDTPVRTYLPSFKMMDAFATERMTPRDLVTHRSGLPRHDFVWYNATLTPQEIVARLPYLEPSADFRTVYQYQNLMYITAGYLIEQVTGQRWEDVVQNRIFSPLGMRRSTCSVQAAQHSGNVALPYRLIHDKVKEQPFQTFDAIKPAGGIHSTLLDLASWLMLYLNDGKHGTDQIVSSAMLRQMHLPQVLIPEPAFPPELSHVHTGLGWNILTFRGHTMVRHGGESEGYSAWVSLLPHDKMGIIVLTNLHGAWLTRTLTYTLYELWLGLDTTPWSQRVKAWLAQSLASEAARPSNTGVAIETLVSHPLEAYTGTFVHPGYGALLVELVGNRLLAIFNGVSMPMQHEHDDVFLLTHEVWDRPRKAVFEADDGTMCRFVVPFEPAVKPIVFLRPTREQISNTQLT